MATVYRQWASPWGTDKYAGETMASSGCGPTACAILLDESPRIIAQWMTKHGYASDGSGTYQSGIFKCIQDRGHDSAKVTPYSLAGKMSSDYFDTFLRSVENGNCAILLMGGKRTGCADNYWCSGGHYISIVGYRRKNGVTELNVIDPYFANHDGWHKWSEFLGDIKHIFTTSIKWKEEEMFILENQKIVDVFDWKPVVRTVAKDKVPYFDALGKQIGTLNSGNKVRVMFKTEKNMGQICIDQGSDKRKIAYMDCAYLRK